MPYLRYRHAIVFSVWCIVKPLPQISYRFLHMAWTKSLREKDWCAASQAFERTIPSIRTYGIGGYGLFLMEQRKECFAFTF